MIQGLHETTAILKLCAIGIAACVLALVMHGCGKRSEVAAHAETRAEHARVLREIADKAHAAAAKAASERAEYDAKALADQVTHAQEVSHAYERGRAAGAGIADGTVRVREVWRDRECPATPAGEGAGPADRHPDVDQGRADAIGRVLGHAWQWDATYGLAIARLTRAQKLLDACYEQPATGVPR